MGCKDCEFCPKTYEEYWMAKYHPTEYCPDAFSDVSQYCGKNQREREDDR